MSDEKKNAASRKEAAKPDEAVEKQDAPPAVEPVELAKGELDCQLRSLRFSSCGRFLAAAGFDSSIRRFRWDQDGENVTLMELLAIGGGHDGWVTHLALHHERPVLFSADSWGRLRSTHLGEDFLAAERLWDHEQAHDGWIRRIVLSPDSSRLATCGRDKFVRVWNAADGKLLAETQGPEDGHVVTFAPDGKGVVHGDEKGSLRLWDYASDQHLADYDGSVFHKYDRIQDIGGLGALAWLDDGQTLVAVGCRPEGGATVRSVPHLALFDAKNGGAPLKSIDLGANKDGYVDDLALHPDGYLMLVSSGLPGTGKLMLLRPQDEKPFHETKLPNLHSIALHPDGARFALTATNKGSNGNGRRLNKEGEYEGNSSPIHLFELQAKG